MRTYCKVDFAVPADHWVKIKESEKRDKYLTHARKQRKLWKMKLTLIQIVISTRETVFQDLENGLEESKIGRRADTIQIVNIGQNTRKSSRNLKTFAVIQTPVKRLLINSCVKISQGV